LLESFSTATLLGIFINSYDKNAPVYIILLKVAILRDITPMLNNELPYLPYEFFVILHADTMHYRAW
jgi:hypothetical protein